MKILAMYLPQYHEVKENNEWWGKGYTEWTAVKQAKSYFEGHIQPKIPLENNYYDLADETASAWKWQSELAKKYNVYGFVIYHYWFKTGKQLLEKPMEILLQHKEIDINYCVCWANETWTRTWYGLENQVLMKQEYGDIEEWTNHFNYLLPFFNDNRYIKINNKPMINIYHTAEIDCLSQMIECWNSLAIDNGFEGVYIVSSNSTAEIDYRKDLFDAYYNFEPAYTQKHKYTKINKLTYRLGVAYKTLMNKFLKNKKIERVIDGKKFFKIMKKRDLISSNNIFPGAFPQWDNTPRRKYKGTYFKNMTPELFFEQLKYAQEKYDNPEFVYVNAWNEWGEGAFLEPEENQKYAYIDILKKI